MRSNGWILAAFIIGFPALGQADPSMVAPAAQEHQSSGYQANLLNPEAGQAQFPAAIPTLNPSHLPPKPTANGVPQVVLVDVMKSLQDSLAKPGTVMIGEGLSSRGEKIETVVASFPANFSAAKNQFPTTRITLLDEGGVPTGQVFAYKTGTVDVGAVAFQNKPGTSALLFPNAMVVTIGNGKANVTSLTDFLKNAK